MKKQINKIEIAEYGKIPPQAMDLEEAVLGALMLERQAINLVIDILNEDCFYSPRNKDVWIAIHHLFVGSFPIDIVTVTQKLANLGKINDVGGAYYVAQLTGKVASASNIEYHARILAQKKIQRDIIKVSAELYNDSYSDEIDVFDLLDKAQTNLNDITGNFIKNKEKGSERLFKEFLIGLDLAVSNKNVSGVPSTIKSLDKITGGWQKSDLIIVAGRPAMGKTAFTKVCINGAINQQKPILMFSLEMSALQLTQRLISEDVGCSTESFRDGSYVRYTSQSEVQKATNKYFGSNGNELLIIDDAAGLTINELKARAKRVYSEKKIELIIIDYLQLVHAGREFNGKSTNDQVTIVAQGLKNLAKELDIPVIALSQLSRKVEERKPPKPILSDLRDSGAIEQAADLVGFLYRPEYYKIDQLEDGTSTSGYGELLIEKHRNGGLGVVKMKFTDYLTKYESWDKDETFEDSNKYNSTFGNSIKPNNEFDEF